jgi:membrane-bound serine protease (ClpP class)
MEPLAPEGHVLVEGEIWNAVSTEPVPAGSPCAWWAMSNYLLRVEPLQPQSSEQPPA